MKTIGIIGGLSWKSSLDYYRMINELVSERLGGWNSAKVILYSLNFNEIDLEHRTKDWKKSDKKIIDAARALENAGADFIILGANTAHVLADKIQKNVKIPLIHIADCAAEKVKEDRITKVGLLGTKHTMNEAFYKKRLMSFGLEVLVPNDNEQQIIATEINNVILGKTSPSAKSNYIKIINSLVKRGAQAVILGCTEIPLIVTQKDVKIPLFDTAKIHVERAVEIALK